MRVKSPSVTMRRSRILVILLLVAITDAVGQSASEETQAPQQRPAPLTDARIMPAHFPIEVAGDLAGLDIAVEAGSAGDDAYLKLTNNQDTAVRCSVQFRNGPESRQRRARLAPQATGMVTGGLRRRVVRLRITLTCGPAS